jgi:hypothetical protein
MTETAKPVSVELFEALGGIEQMKEAQRLRGAEPDPMLDKIGNAIERALGGIQVARAEAIARLDSL